MRFLLLLRRFWPQLCLFLLVSLLCWLNFTSNTFLTGWDNLQVEFDFPINIERALNVSWQEYQGLGLLGGMGHAADLLRQLFLWFSSIFLSQNFLRYFWNLCTLLLGVFGAYKLLLYFLNSDKKNLSSQALAFFGASFYLLNIGTVQNFYPNYDPFSAFFAFLPWLLWSLFKYLETANKKNLLYFALFSLLGTTFAYVQTIFVVYVLLLLLIFVYYLFSHKKISIKEKLKKILLLLTVVFVSNAFWLLPTSYFTLSNSETTISAKGNLMSTGVTFLRNNKFGNFYDLFTLKGFWLDYGDFDQWGNSVHLMDVWKTHLQNSFVVYISIAFFLILVFGIVSLSISKKFKPALPILVLFVFSAFILLGSNPPFGFIYEFLRSHLPLFGQIFRSSYTKWIVPFSLFYSLLVAFGLAFIFSLFKKNIFKIMTGFIFFIALIFYSLPSFQGHFFYERLRVQIPEAYFELFAYFKTVPESTRIANLPQHNFYAWQWNDWGYRGSGFLWYGIKQPILDRAFDVWSGADEAYYWELQTALDKKDVKILEEVLEKYDVDYLLLDESIVNRNTVKPFNYQAIKDLLLSSHKITLIREFDFISLYTFNDLENSREKDFIILYEDLPIINNAYQFSWNDQAFNDFHDYLSSNDGEIIYPFSSLFTNNLQENLEFIIDEDENFFYLNSLKNLSDKNLNLEIKNLLETEAYLPFHLTWTTKDDQTTLIFEALLPEIYLADKKYYFDLAKELTLDSKLCQTDQNCFLNINNQLLGSFTKQGEMDVLLRSKVQNTIALSAETKTDYFDYVFFDLSFFNLEPKVLQTEQNLDPMVRIPKVLVQNDLLKSDLNIDKVNNCRPLNGGSFAKEKKADGNLYSSIGTSVCDYFYLEQLHHQASYLFKLDVNNLESIPFVFAIQAESLGRSPLETYLSEGLNYQILPPTENFNKGYTLYLSTDSYGHELNENLLKSAEVFFWPYNFLKNVSLQAPSANNESMITDCDFSTEKKALWFYKVSIPASCSSKYLKLSQAHDNGWLAFGDGKLLKHTKLNNWANAWTLNGSSDQSSESSIIYIFFWPQLLEYLGFGFLVLNFIFFTAFFYKKS
ncbi:hypothetical protein KKI22_02060 [Patescibacteria group bacterium]|nr:hypothetical protein [Patescibacteria group bacterium]